MDIFLPAHTNFFSNFIGSKPCPVDKKYIQFITDLKSSIVQSRYAAARLANKEQLLLYLKTGKMLSERIAAEKWGSKILQQIADDLQRQLPGLRGFSYNSLKNMRQFAAEYATFLNGHQKGPFRQSLTAQLSPSIGQSPTGQLRNVRKAKKNKSMLQAPPAAFIEQFFGISFTHHILLLNKCKSAEERIFYIEQAATQFWSVAILEYKIAADIFSHQGKLPSNFDKTLQGELKSSALQVFQDEYLMNFITTGEINDERVLEEKVVADIKNFIMRMGKGFCFIGNQFRLEVGGEEFFVDLLFFNRHLQCLVAFELKRGKFRPEHAGQLNFYLNVLDEKVKLPGEKASIGIVLCKEKNNTVVEFAVRSIDKAMGVATYRTSKEVPKEMKGILPEAGQLAKLL